MKRIALVVLLAACVSRPAVVVDPALPPATDAGVARVQKLIEQQPDNVAFHYVLARHYDRLRDLPNVLRELEELRRRGWDLGIGPHHFPNTRGDARFREAAARLEARERAVQRARAAFTFSKERDVRSEGIAYDPADDRFVFSGGPASLLRVDRGGAITELSVEPEGRSFERLGMRVDAERRQLWTLAAVFDAKAPAEEKGRSVLSVYDLRDGRLLRRISEGSAEQRATLNDLTLLKDGTAFVTDTERDLVLRLAPDADRFEVVADGLRGPNGIAASADERTLYVADFYGIHTIDLASRSRRLLETKTPLNAIDGLVEHRGALIAIQNNLGRPRVLRIRRRKVEVLEAKNPLLDVPSTGVVAGNQFFFLANRSNRPAERVVLAIAL
ncbi:MAG TPA: SMP-30/gluconolactonase/LRE family protein [Thermoanaerobaculia bacterium]